MELKLIDGKYTAAVGGGLKCVGGAQELAQRAAMKLSARKGSFWPCPSYGSELYRLLCGERPENMEAAVRRYAAEALADEPYLGIGSIELASLGTDGLRITLHLTYTGGSFELTLDMEDGYENA